SNFCTIVKQFLCEYLSGKMIYMFHLGKIGNPKVYIFIINPAAGHGKAKRDFEALTNSKPYQQINSIYYYTRYEEHAEIIAEQIENKYRQSNQLLTVMVICGDGIFHEDVTGFDSASIPLGFILGVTGNDFARGAYIKAQPKEILQRIIQSDPSKIY